MTVLANVLTSGRAAGKAYPEGRPIMLNVLGRSKVMKCAADRLYAAVVTRARQPVFFVNFAVLDTLDGRFDLLMLHAWLVLTQIKTNAPLAQAFVDRLFIGFDEALRELGAGDIGMGRRVKKLADAFYGRLAAYDAAIDVDAMSAALTRNLYRGAENPCAGAMAAYVLGAKAHLRLTQKGEVDFGPLPSSDSGQE